MLKFLRKYNKILLVVGGSFLMVAFMAPQAIQNLGADPNKQTVVRFDGKAITRKQLDIARRERSAVRTFYSALLRDQVEIPEALLGMLFPNQPQQGLYAGLLAQSNPTLFVLIPSLIGDDDKHWLLLAHAAREAGYVGETLDGETWGQSFLPALLSVENDYQNLLRQVGLVEGDPLDVNAVTDITLARVEAARRIALAESRLPPDDFHRALATARGIQRMWDDYLGLNRVSDRAVKITAADRLELVTGDYVLIPADLGEAGGASSMDDLRAFFEQHRSTRPEDSDLGVGYVLPARVKLEYLTVDRAAIERYITIADPDVRTELRLNRDEYPEDEARAFEIIRANLKRQRVAAAMAKADDFIRDAVNAEVFPLAREEGYRVLPEDWSPPRMEDLRRTVWRELDREFGRGPNPDPNAEPFPSPEVTVLDAEWQTRPMLARLGLGTVRVGVNSVAFQDLVFQVRAIAGANPRRLQVGVPAIDLPVQSAFGNVTYFTILDARPESPADTFEEVRDEVARDYAELAGYRSLRDRLDEFRELAANEGLDAVAALFPAPPATDDTAPPPQPVRGAFQANRASAGLGIGEGSPDNVPLRQLASSDERLPEAVFAVAEGIDPTVDPEAIPRAERVFAVALPRARAVLVGVINRDSPLTIERFRLTSQFLARQVRQSGLIEASPGDPATRTIFDVIDAAFGMEALTKRYNFVDLDKDDDDTDNDDTSGDAPGEGEAEDAADEGDDSNSDANSDADSDAGSDTDG